MSIELLSIVASGSLSINVFFMGMLVKKLNEIGKDVADMKADKKETEYRVKILEHQIREINPEF